MIITKTPFRMSFFGGGTDLPEFFRENGGAVISTTFDKYCYVNVRHLPRFFQILRSEAFSGPSRISSFKTVAVIAFGLQFFPRKLRKPPGQVNIIIGIPIFLIGKTTGIQRFQLLFAVMIYTQ